MFSFKSALKPQWQVCFRWTSPWVCGCSPRGAPLLPGWGLKYYLAFSCLINPPYSPHQRWLPLSARTHPDPACSNRRKAFLPLPRWNQKFERHILKSTWVSARLCRIWLYLSRASSSLSPSSSVYSASKSGSSKLSTSLWRSCTNKFQVAGSKMLVLPWSLPGAGMLGPWCSASGRALPSDHQHLQAAPPWQQCAPGVSLSVYSTIGYCYTVLYGLSEKSKNMLSQSASVGSCN